MTERELVSATADVLKYSDTSKKWMPGGSTPGVSKVKLYQNSADGGFRIIAWKLPEQEVVTNCFVTRSFNYNQATSTFHQFRDSTTQVVFGFNFHSKDDAEAFAKGITSALSSLDNQLVASGSLPMAASPANPVSPCVPHRVTHPTEGSTGFPDSLQTLKEPHPSPPSTSNSCPTMSANERPASPFIGPPAQSKIDVASGGGLPPPQSTAVKPQTGGPPPPPPPPPPFGGPQTGGSLAEALQGALSKKKVASSSAGAEIVHEPPKPTAAAPSSMGLMDEMAKALARRRVGANKPVEVSGDTRKVGSAVSGPAAASASGLQNKFRLRADGAELEHETTSLAGHPQNSNQRSKPPPNEGSVPAATTNSSNPIKGSSSTSNSNGGGGGLAADEDTCLQVTCISDGTTCPTLPDNQSPLTDRLTFLEADVHSLRDKIEKMREDIIREISKAKQEILEAMSAGLLGK